jgi:hypothetical protein
VGWRVTFHFVMNLLPMPFVMIALMQQWSAAHAFGTTSRPSIARTRPPTGEITL